MLSNIRSGRAFQFAARSVVSDNLKQLANALINYADANKGLLPATASFDRQGRPLLSWRVHLLPFLGEGKLYKDFHLDEPWDSAHNRKLLTRMPPVYRGPSGKLNREGKTLYLAPAGEGGSVVDPGQVVPRHGLACPGGDYGAEPSDAGRSLSRPVRRRTLKSRTAAAVRCNGSFGTDAVMVE